MGIDAEMLVRVDGSFSKNITETYVRDLAYQLASAFGHDRFWIARPGEHFGPEGRHALELVDVWEQDGPDINPEPGEKFIKVNIATRYYGINYERGDLALIIMVAEWLERKIPGVSIWYGGDSSGVVAEPFGHKERMELFEHFVKVGGEPYARAFERDKTGAVRARSCAFCGGREMIQNMWGGGSKTAGVYCSGCGLRERTDDGGETWRELKKGEEGC